MVASLQAESDIFPEMVYDDIVYAIELNTVTFDMWGNTSTYVIFRDCDGSIVDCKFLWSDIKIHDRYLTVSEWDPLLDEMVEKSVGFSHQYSTATDWNVNEYEKQIWPRRRGLFKQVVFVP